MEKTEPNTPDKDEMSDRKHRGTGEGGCPSGTFPEKGKTAADTSTRKKGNEWSYLLENGKT